MWHDASSRSRTRAQMAGSSHFTVPSTWAVTVVARVITSPYAFSNSNDATAIRLARALVDVDGHPSVESCRRNPRETMVVEWHRGLAGS